MKRPGVWEVIIAAVSIGAVILLVQVGWNIVARPATGGPDLWTVLSAIATAAATIVALSVAMQTSRQKKHEDDARARLAAAQLAPMLLFQVGRVRVAVNTLDDFVQFDGNPSDYVPLRDSLRSIAEGSPAFELLHAITPLPNDCAERIASGFGQIDLAHKMLAQEEAFWTVNPRLAAVRKWRCGMLAGLTKGALEMLEQALHTCNQAARIKIGGTKVK